MMLLLPAFLKFDDEELLSKTYNETVQYSPIKKCQLLHMNFKQTVKFNLQYDTVDLRVLKS